MRFRNHTPNTGSNTRRTMPVFASQVYISAPCATLKRIIVMLQRRGYKCYSSGLNHGCATADYLHGNFGQYHVNQNALCVYTDGDMIIALDGRKTKGRLSATDKVINATMHNMHKIVKQFKPISNGKR